MFDIQDVGVRFFTYLSTLHLVMEACADSKVPVIVLDKNVKVVENGKLADIAPSILKLMDIDKPNEMSGLSII